MACLFRVHADPPLRGLHRALTACFGALMALGIGAAASPALAQDTPGGTSPDTTRFDQAVNPFAGFETHYLDNGLKVWLKVFPGLPNVSVTMLVPYGSDRDPPGKEQLAHFTGLQRDDGDLPPRLLIARKHADQDPVAARKELGPKQPIEPLGCRRDD